MIGSLALQALNMRPGISMRRAFGVMGMGGRIAHLSLFVGQWAPTLLVLGLYNKMVKTMGSEGIR